MVFDIADLHRLTSLSSSGHGETVSSSEDNRNNCINNTWNDYAASKEIGGRSRPIIVNTCNGVVKFIKQGDDNSNYRRMVGVDPSQQQLEKDWGTPSFDKMLGEGLF